MAGQEQRPGQAPRRTLADRLLRRNLQTPAESPAPVAVAQPVAHAAVVGEARVDRKRSNAPLIVAGLAAALVGGVIFHDDLGRLKDNAGIAINSIGKDGSKEGAPTASSAAAGDGEKAKAAREKEIADAVAKALKERDQADTKAKAEAASKPAELIKFTLADAASNGADDFSKNVKNWEWAPGEVGFAAKLKTPTVEDGNTVTRINLPTDGVAEGYLDVTRLGNSKINPAVSWVAHGGNQKQVEGRGMVLRRSADTDKLYLEVVEKHIANEIKDQPGVLTLEVCPPPLTGVVKTSVETIKFTLADAANWGQDDFSKNVKNWEWAPGEVGFAAKLKTPKDPKDRIVTRVKLPKDAVAESYFGTPTRSTSVNDAISWVAHANQEVVEGRGMVIRRSARVDDLYLEVYEKHVANEIKTQPGVITFGVRKCPTLPPAK